MTWRSIVISNPCRLRRDKFRLAIEQEQTAYIPFEDIALILLNHREINLSHAVLTACGEFGISLFSTGDTHQPNGVFLPFLQHSRATRWLRLQLALSKPVVKRSWAAIVRSKLNNQAACLRLNELEGDGRLESYARRIRSGDPDNLEGQAAAYYFTQVFGRNFKRSKDCLVNSVLDYGYAIIRGAIARGLVAHGLMPSIGLFHASEQNAFNLADDVIEPFRPLVDLFVYRNFLSRPEEDSLQPTDKAALVSLLNVDMEMPRGKMSALSAIEQCIESLARIYESGDDKLLELPVLIGAEQHSLEF